MRIHRRHGARIALIGAAALLVAGAATALANNVSTLSGTKITPTKLPKTTFKPVSLFVHTGTIYTHPGDKAHGGFAKTVTLLFDNDGKITPGSVPQCAGTFTSGTTLKQAWDTCGPGAGAAKNAYLSPPSAVSGRASTAPPSNFNGCVLAFRGKNTAQGNPTLVLFTRVTLAVNGTANCANPAQQHVRQHERHPEGDDHQRRGCRTSGRSSRCRTSTPRRCRWTTSRPPSSVAIT